MISMPEEMAELRSMVQGVAEEVLHERGVSLDYLIGAMVETPRAALLAGRSARMPISCSWDAMTSLSSPGASHEMTPAPS